MARTIEHRIGLVDIDGNAFVALTRYLPADATHAETRVKGGLWADASDAKALAHMRDLALAYATACEERIATLAKPKPAPKAPKAPEKPAPKCDDASHAQNAEAGAKFCPLCGKDLTALRRADAVAKARASKPTPTPKVSAPTPEKRAAFDWAEMVGK